MNEAIDAELIPEDRSVALSSGNAVAMRRGEIVAQSDLATRKPRSIAAFREEVESLALLNRESAAMCFFAKPTGEGKVVGPSIRFAELLRMSWGNISAGAEVVRVEERSVTARGYAIDIEKNVSEACEVSVSIRKRNGQRYSDDMILVAGQAAMAKAKRNAIFAVIPRALTDSILKKCMALAGGQGIPLVQARQEAFAKAIDFLGTKGFKLTEARILAALEKSGIEDVTHDDLGVLHGLVCAVRDGETTFAAAFPDPSDSDDSPRQRPQPMRATPAPASTATTTPNREPARDDSGGCSDDDEPVNAPATEIVGEPDVAQGRCGGTIEAVTSKTAGNRGGLLYSVKFLPDGRDRAQFFNTFSETVGKWAEARRGGRAVLYFKGREHNGKTYFDVVAMEGAA